MSVIASSRIGAAGGDEELCGQVGARETPAHRSAVARFATLVQVGGAGCATSFGDGLYGWVVFTVLLLRARYGRRVR